jgi:PAS domain S-box-containing protein
MSKDAYSALLTALQTDSAISTRKAPGAFQSDHVSVMDQIKNLLIIDDDPNIHEMLRQVLSGPDFSLTFASSGAEGIAKAAELIPDLILLEVMLPGMDGFVICRKLRATPTLAVVPIILVTAHDDRATRVRGLEAGADDCISKRFDFVELQARVRAIIRLNRYRRSTSERATFERVMQFSPNGVLLLDAAGAIRLINPAALRLLGAAQQHQVLGHPIRTFVVPEYPDQWAVGLHGILSERAVPVRIKAICVRLDGSAVPVEVDIGPFVWDAQPLTQLIVRDMTERQRAEEALQQSERRRRDLFEHAPDAIFVITHEGIVRDVNPAAGRLYGLPQERLLGQHVADLAPPERRVRAAELLSTLGHGAIGYFEGFSATADGRTIPVEIRISPTEYAGAPALLLHVRDIAERKQIEAQLLQAQKMEGIGQLASGVAHDFNNLLTVISGYANLALDQITPGDPLYSDLRDICTVVERAARLTRQLLAFARQQVIEPQVLNLNDLILDLDKLLRHLIGEGIELVTTLASDLVNIKADSSQIEQLLVNLVINARDAMPAGGKLLIETHNIEADQAVIRRHLGMSTMGEVCLTVTDTGTGMDTTVKRHLFELFYTTKALGKGTGLGLATCYAIVKQHSGHIEVDSEVGQGTTFTIYLPAASHARD